MGSIPATEPAEVVAVVQLLALPAPEQPTAFFADGDGLAIAVVAALEHHDIAVGPAIG